MQRDAQQMAPQTDDLSDSISQLIPTCMRAAIKISRMALSLLQHNHPCAFYACDYFIFQLLLLP
jgi:hypothetical protein